MAADPNRPGPTGYKNLLTGAAADLTLGDQLNAELEAQLADRKKRLLSGARTAGIAPMLGGSLLDLGLTPNG